MISNTFCILPWIHLYTNPDGNVLPCCIGDYRMPLGNIQKNTLEEVWNSDKFKTMRLNMLNGKKCNECDACYKNEAANNHSFRQSSNEQYAEFIPLANLTTEDGSADLNLKYLDIRWSNICNFKCKGCSGTYSSSWAKEENRKDVFIFAGGKSNDDLYNQLIPHLSGIKEIYFAGGEPLLMDKHYEILQHLIDTKNTKIKIRYNTNLSKLSYKGISVIDLWKHFSNIHLSVSLDHYGERAEYIREGTDWNVLQHHIHTIRNECPHIHLGIATVVSVFNVYTLPEFIEYMIEQNLVDNKTYTNMYSIINPEFYSFNILDSELKQKALDKLSKVRYTKQLDDQLQNVIGHLNNSVFNKEAQLQFKQKTEYYDSLRQKQFKSVFPELEEFYDRI